METMRLPFAFESREILTFEEQQARMREIAQQFLDMLKDTSPGHRDDYGDFIRGRITGIEDIDFMFHYSGFVEIERL
jgi:hypothetical protein